MIVKVNGVKFILYRVINSNSHQLEIYLHYSGEFFRTAFSQKIDVKLSKTLSILTLPKYTSEGVL